MLPIALLLSGELWLLLSIIIPFLKPMAYLTLLVGALSHFIPEWADDLATRDLERSKEQANDAEREGLQ